MKKSKKGNVGKKIISVVVALLAIALGLITQNFNEDKYKVVRVVDGDTLIVQIDDKEERVRLIGVDTPESVHPDASKNVEAGKVASEFTKSRLEGEYIELEFDVQERDKYGRLLAYVWHNGEMFNKVLLREGYAQVATFPPNVKYVEEFTQLEREAREAKRGLWADLLDDSEKEEDSTNSEPVQGNKGDKQTAKENTKDKYVASKNSDKYHLANYTHAGEISPENQIWFNSIEEAEKMGYKPCGICFKK